MHAYLIAFVSSFVLTAVGLVLLVPFQVLVPFELPLGLIAAVLIAAFVCWLMIRLTD